MDHDVAVVKQDPPAVALALSAYGLGADVAKLLFDLVDDGPHLPVVRRRAQHEGVGDHQLVGHVEGDDVVSELVGGRLGRGGDELDGPISCCHVASASFCGV